MDNSCPQAEIVKPTGGGQATWWGWLLLVPFCAAFGLLAGWGAVQVAVVFSPLIVFPFLLGLLLGACLVATARMVEFAHRPTLAVAALVLSVSAVLTQHYLGYREACQKVEQESATILLAREKLGESVQARLPLKPAGFVDFMCQRAERGRVLSTAWGKWTAKGAAAWTTWGLDGLLVVGPCLGLVILGWRRPYCRECRSWYRTTQAGRLEPAMARRAAELVGLDLPDGAPAARFTLSGCAAGCGPLGFRVSWEGASGRTDPATVWLGDPKRTALADLLDEARRRAASDRSPAS
ncbi:MAG: hypothetical protein JW818_02825 [Pirellulales bacterium]|nr:hypothetical protein [Pirellulales bacterium]